MTAIQTIRGAAFPSALLVLAFAASPLAFAQLITGSVTGSVQDTSGAAVAGTAVRLTNTGTGASQTTSSDSLGNFQFQLLPSGTYVLEATNSGFKTFRREGIIVETARSLAVPVVLSLGQVTETVDVVGGTPLLEPNTSSLSTVMDRQKIDELPLIALNPMGLAKLIPTVKAVTVFGGPVLTTFSSGLVQIGGGSSASQGFLIDGMANDKIGDAPGAMTYLTADATQEFKVLTNSMSAEFGRTAGGVISVVSRSGSNQFHGGLFEFHRNDNLNANDFFSNRSGAPRPPLSLNQFGGSLGGPIKRQKLFFFINAEIYKERRSKSRVTTSPSALERIGDYSDTRTADGQLVTVYDPLTTRPNPTTAGASIRTAFPGNAIPSNRISKISQEIFKLYPLGNLPGLPFTRTQNLFQTTSTPIDRNTWGVKIDYNLNESRRLAVRYTRDQLYWNSDDFFNNILDEQARKFVYTPRHSASLQYTESITPTLLLDAKMGLNRDYDQGITPATALGGFDITTWGFPASLKSQLPIIKNAETGLTPGITIGDANAVGGGTPHGRAGTTWANGVSLTKIQKTHTLKGGYEYRFYSHNPFNGSTPTFTFNRGFTQGPDPNRASANAGYGVASFVLGYPGSGSFTFNADDTKSERYHALYLQDDWKATQRLTLNLGMRWEYESPLNDRFNVFTNFDPYIDSPLKVPGLALKGGLAFPGVNGVPRGVYDPNYHNFGPRFGFGYQARSNFVVRGGYGISFIPVKGTGFSQRTGFSSTTAMNTSIDGGLTPYDTIANPFPNGLNRPTGSSLGALTGLGTSVTGQIRSFTPGYAQQWNFTLQYEPWANWLVEGAYVGNKGVHLITGNNLNQLHPQYMALGNQLNTTVPNPFFGLPQVSSGALTTATVARQRLLVPFPQYTGVSGGYGNLGDSNYQAFTLKVEKRFSRGFSLLLAYALTKLIDNSPGDNMYDFRYSRSKSVDDTPQRLVYSALWELPIGKSLHGWQRHLVAGWQVNAITTLQSGNTISFGATHPDVVPGVSAKLDNPTIDKWFNTAAFRPAAPFTFGTSSRTIPNVMGPGLFNIDFSVFKDFALREKVKLQLRGAAFNLTNTPQFLGPGTTVGTANFGVVTGTGIVGSNYFPMTREVQIALRLTF
jgi:hypothetical protein